MVGSRSPDGWDQIPYRPGGWVLHHPPWSFGFMGMLCHGHVMSWIPKREEPGKTGAPCVKVPGSSRVPPGKTGAPCVKVPGSSRVPPPPRAQLCNRSCSNKHTLVTTVTEVSPPSRFLGVPPRQIWRSRSGYKSIVVSFSQAALGCSRPVVYIHVIDKTRRVAPPQNLVLSQDFRRDFLFSAQVPTQIPSPKS